jgi:O-antigen/teichoic acid export membrane protein
MITLYRVYCIKKFEETHFRFVWKPNLLKPLVSFSAWNLYGNFGGVVQQQGTNFVINVFYGVVMNAAVSVGLTIANVVNLFASNLMTAFRPQIIKYYSQGAKEQMKNLTVLALKVIMFIYSLVAVPVFIEAENLLDIWLVEVPDKSLIICRLFLISIFFETIRYILIINIHASGNVKRVSLAAGTVFILVPFATYLLFKLGLDVKVAVIVIIASNIILCAVNLFLIGYYVKISMRPYAATIAQIVFSTGLALILAIFIAKFIPSSYIHMITRGVISIALVVCTYTVFCLNKEQRAYAFGFIKSKLKL